MKVTITNNDLTATIKLKGAELCSLKTNSNNEEYIWQADPEIWGSSAPVLFPITGVLKNGQTRIDNKEFSIPKHGICRTRHFDVMEQSTDSATLRLRSSTDTKIYYPSEFELLIKFTLRGKSLQVHYTVLNKDTTVMIASIGSHPAFALPTGNPEDYRLAFDDVRALMCASVTPDGLIDSLETERFLNPNNELPLDRHLFDRDALVMLNQSLTSVSLIEADRSKRLTMHWKTSPHLGIWSKPGAAFVCIEPWQSYADTPDSNGILADKPGMTEVPINGSLVDSYTIEIH